MNEALPPKARLLLRKLESRDAVCAVIGMGYVGLPLMLELARAGFRVIGIDVEEDRVARVNRGESYLGDVASEDLAAFVKEGRLAAAPPGQALIQADTISICVPTPLRKTKDPDISYIVSATKMVQQNFKEGALVVLESTTYPGTTEEVILPELSKAAGVVGEDFFLAFSPERVDPGNKTYTTRNTPKVVGGMTDACTRLAIALYGAAVEKVATVLVWFHSRKTRFVIPNVSLKKSMPRVARCGFPCRL